MQQVGRCSRRWRDLTSLIAYVLDENYIKSLYTRISYALGCVLGLNGGAAEAR